MRTARVVGRVHDLPQNAFGSAAVTWWAVVLLMVIEGTTLAIVAGAYLYTRGSYNEWPPAHTPLPSLGVPLVNLVLFALSVVPAWWARRSALRHDVGGIQLSLSVQGLLGVAIMVMRYYECWALNVRWDTNAYGSVAWALLIAHATLMITDVMDTIGLAAMFLLREPEEKHFVDTCENTQFWYFIVAVWLPTFILAFLFPRWV